ncbi:MAG TPA: SDR family oxidoreductase [Longimicrobium sp.]|nr:SDR family oxidoreductase [Longimicrobium sp.]
MSRYDEVRAALRGTPCTWLVTGCAGFIGSSLAEELLRLGQRVVGLDSLATGYARNLDDVRQGVGDAAWTGFRFIDGDVRDPGTCAAACAGADYVLHQAAIGSVPRSVHDPLETHEANLTGFLNVLLAARDAGVRRFVYAASSATYGDCEAVPAVEDRIGRPLSPYAVTKHANELYAGVFERAYGVRCVGLRYFNVFGRRQDPHGEYAAVIPRWVAELLAGRPCTIHGDGETSRDFCYVADVVQANLLAACVDAELPGAVYNVALGRRTTLNELFRLIRGVVAEVEPRAAAIEPRYGPFRPGDVRHSQADLSRIRALLGYEPAYSVAQGLREALSWYARMPAPAG